MESVGQRAFIAAFMAFNQTFYANVSEGYPLVFFWCTYGNDSKLKSKITRQIKSPRSAVSAFFKLFLFNKKSLDFHFLIISHLLKDGPAFPHERSKSCLHFNNQSLSFLDFPRISIFYMLHLAGKLKRSEAQAKVLIYPSASLIAYK